MKLQFNLVINGSDSLENKVHNAAQENPNFHVELIRAFAQTIMLAFRLNSEDNIIVESFRLGKVETPEVIPENSTATLPQSDYEGNKEEDSNEPLEIN